MQTNLKIATAHLTFRPTLRPRNDHLKIFFFNFHKNFAIQFRKATFAIRFKEKRNVFELKRILNY